jgi:DNA-binding MarR family transcriptional regulator
MREGQELADSVRQLMESVFMRAMKDWTRYVKSTGLSVPQFGLLMRLFHGGGCAVQDVGAHFDITSAAASQLVEKLVQAGLVERAEDPDDRRARRLTLTARGRSLVKNSIEERYRWVSEALHMLPADARNAVRRALPVLQSALVQPEERTPA